MGLTAVGTSREKPSSAGGSACYMVQIACLLLLLLLLWDTTRSAAVVDTWVSALNTVYFLTALSRG